MAKVMKKAQTGKNVPKGMVESEMFPGKMIPKSKSNYENSNYDKMLGGRSSAPKPKGLNFDKKSFDKLPTLKSKVIKKPKAQGGLLLKAVGRSLERSIPKRAMQTAENIAKSTATKNAEKAGFKVTKYLSGPYGGDAQIAGRVAEGKTDMKRKCDCLGQQGTPYNMTYRQQRPWQPTK